MKHDHSSEDFFPHQLCKHCNGGDSEEGTENEMVICDCCVAVGAHLKCLAGAGTPILREELESPGFEWFCSEECESISRGLVAATEERMQLEKSGIYTAELVRYSSNYRTSQQVVDKVVSMFHGAFGSARYSDNSDLVELVCRGQSHTIDNPTDDEDQPPDCTNFRVMVLRKGGSIIAAAAVRVHGPLMAELPYVITQSGYRRDGNCRRLMSAVDGLMESLGVRWLVVPAAERTLPIWETHLGFVGVRHEACEHLEDRIICPDGTKILIKAVGSGFKPLASSAGPSSKKRVRFSLASSANDLDIDGDSDAEGQRKKMKRKAEADSDDEDEYMADSSSDEDEYEDEGGQAPCTECGFTGYTDWDQDPDTGEVLCKPCFNKLTQGSAGGGGKASGSTPAAAAAPPGKACYNCSATDAAKYSRHDNGEWECGTCVRYRKKHQGQVRPPSVYNRCKKNGSAKKAAASAAAAAAAVMRTPTPRAPAPALRTPGSGGQATQQQRRAPAVTAAALAAVKVVSVRQRSSQLAQTTFGLLSMMPSATSLSTLFTPYETLDAGGAGVAGVAVRVVEEGVRATREEEETAADEERDAVAARERATMETNAVAAAEAAEKKDAELQQMALRVQELEAQLAQAAMLKAPSPPPMLLPAVPLLAAEYGGSADQPSASRSQRLPLPQDYLLLGSQPRGGEAGSGFEQAAADAPGTHSELVGRQGDEPNFTAAAVEAATPSCSRGAASLPGQTEAVQEADAALPSPPARSAAAVAAASFLKEHSAAAAAASPVYAGMQRNTSSNTHPTTAAQAPPPVSKSAPAIFSLFQGLSDGGSGDESSMEDNCENDDDVKSGVGEADGEMEKGKDEGGSGGKAVGRAQRSRSAGRAASVDSDELGGPELMPSQGSQARAASFCGAANDAGGEVVSMELG